MKLTDSPAEGIPAGLTTLRMWATSHGRTYDHVRNFWRKRQGFPDPVCELPSRGRHGGGTGEQLWEESALDGWLAAQPDLHPPERIALSALDIGADDRISLGRFADLVGKARKTVTQHRDRPGFPKPGADGRYCAGDLVSYWNSRTGRRGPGLSAVVDPHVTQPPWNTAEAKRTRPARTDEGASPRREAP